MKKNTDICRLVSQESCFLKWCLGLVLNLCKNHSLQKNLTVCMWYLKVNDAKIRKCQNQKEVPSAQGPHLWLWEYNDVYHIGYCANNYEWKETPSDDVDFASELICFRVICRCCRCHRHSFIHHRHHRFTLRAVCLKLQQTVENSILGDLRLSFFSLSLGGQLSFCGATGTPVLDF